MNRGTIATRSGPKLELNLNLFAFLAQGERSMFSFLSSDLISHFWFWFRIGCKAKTCLFSGFSLDAAGIPEQEVEILVPFYPSHIPHPNCDLLNSNLRDDPSFCSGTVIYPYFKAPLHY